MLTTIALLVLTGVSVSLISTLLGIGGGVIAIPLMLQFIDNLPPSVAAGTMLCVTAINCSYNSYNFSKHGLKPTTFIIPLIVSMMIGSMIGSQISSMISAKYFNIIFSLLLIITAIKNIASTSETNNLQEIWGPPDKMNKKILALFFILIGGIISGLTGIGGGVVIIPTLVLLYAPPTKIIPMYSNFIMAAGSIAGGVSHLLSAKETTSFAPMFQVGHVNLAIMLSILVGAIATSGFGIKIGKKMPQKAGKIFFSLFMVIMAIKLVIT